MSTQVATPCCGGTGTDSIGGFIVLMKSDGAILTSGKSKASLRTPSYMTLENICQPHLLRRATLLSD